MFVDDVHLHLDIGIMYLFVLQKIGNRQCSKCDVSFKVRHFFISFEYFMFFFYFSFYGLLRGFLELLSSEAYCLKYTLYRKVCFMWFCDAHFCTPVMSTKAIQYHLKWILLFIVNSECYYSSLYVPWLLRTANFRFEIWFPLAASW